MSEINKKTLTERDICTKFINPALESAGWDLVRQIREQYYFTDGQVKVRGKTVTRGDRKFVDYLLFYKSNIPLAVIEAKDNSHSIGSGMQQGLGYAESLDVPFVFSTNGDGFLFHDRLATSGQPEQELRLDQFPSPESLWERLCEAKGTPPDALKVITQDYYSDGGNRPPRYYQMVAINRTVEAIARGQKRVLLVMATGTGKTMTAFQIIWRLWKSGAAKRILFLADRNILVDQTKTNDFKPFGNAMAKIANRKIDKSFEIYLSLYQAVSGTEESSNIYKQFSPDFFDLIVIDECHRGSASENSSWREILDYFTSATQIGLTATPKETEDVSNMHYFGESVYTYSLKQGIEDGFLAPYKVVRVDIDVDLAGYRPEAGKTDKFGHVIEDRIYNQSDMDRKLVIEPRTQLVAKRVTQFLKATNRMDKTIVFCEDIDHAERMRQALVNENADMVAKNRKYIMRITGDSTEGKAELDQFIHPEEPYPVIVTTSELMTTGVDTKTTKLIVLDKSIKSPTKFKQIIGRGTRIVEDCNKLWFTIIDFKKATDRFADPDFDGEPVQIYKPEPGEPIVPPDDIEEGETTTTGGAAGPLGTPEEGEDIEGGEEGTPVPPAPPVGPGGGPLPPGPRKYYVSDVPVKVIGERVQYYGNDGKLITESLKDFTRKTVRAEFSSLDLFLQKWSSANKKQTIIEELARHDVYLEELAEQVGKDFDPFDLICHVAFDQPPLTRRERADNVKKRNYFAKYGDKARAVLEALLDKYADEGIEHIETTEILKVQPFNKLGTPVEIIRLFGNKENFEQAVRDLETALYTLAK